MSHKQPVYRLMLSLVLLMACFTSIEAHRSGCHRWHSCPSDHGSYTCGDLGYCRIVAIPHENITGSQKAMFVDVGKIALQQESSVMEKWEYKRVRITAPLGQEGDDFEEWAIHRLNLYGEEGWEACNLRENQQCWLVLLKRKVA